MQFYRDDVSKGASQLKDYISLSLNRGQRVLWLVSGGSNAPIVTDVMSALDQKDQNKLTIMLSDERYGNVGHAGSNAQQLLAAGFNPKGAVFLPVLIDKPLEETVEKYNRLISQWLEQSQIIIGQLGIGADGHTVGILPYSPATAVKEAFVTNYPADDYSRITITFPALRRISTAYVFAYGNSKQFTLKLLKEKDLPLEEQPAQILKAIPITYIYNDELEGEA